MNVIVDKSDNLELYTNTETGDIHYNVTEVVLNLQIAQGSVKLDKLFNDDEVMTNATNLFLNQNWKELEPEIKSEIERVASKEAAKILNRPFNTYPVKVLLPD